MANSSSYLERNIEIMNSWLDDLVEENRKFASYARSSSKIRADHIRWTSKRLLENAARKQDGEDPLPLNIEDSDERPLPECTETRLEPLLMIGQLEKYASQVNDHVDASLQKIAVTSTMYNNSD